jgi:hypothetical protein
MPALRTHVALARSHVAASGVRTLQERVLGSAAWPASEKAIANSRLGVLAAARSAALLWREAPSGAVLGPERSAGLGA